MILGSKIAVIIAAVIVVFYQDLAIVANDALQSDFSSHILAIPLLFAYLIYRKRKMLKAVVPLENQDQPKETRYLPTIAGIIISTTAILLYWHGSYTFTPLEYHMFALPIFLTGLILILFNTQTLRQLAFPLVFLIFLTPPPSEILYSLGSTLSIVSSIASFAIVNAIGIPSVLTSEFGNPVIQVTGSNGTIMKFAVDIACSGIYSLIGFLIFAVFITYIIRDKLWKKVTLFFIGLSLIYALNITRITTILLIGYSQGEEVALQLFHTLGGWILIFIGTLLLLTISEKVFHTQIFTKPQQKCLECNPKHYTSQNFCHTCGKILKPESVKFHKTDVVKMGAIVASVILLMSIQPPVFAFTQGPAIVVINTPSGQQVSTEILPKTAGYELYFAYRERSFEEVAKQDMTLVYVYTPTDQLHEPVFATVEIASSRQYLYNWEICLKTGQIYPFGHQDINQIDLKDIQLQQNPPVVGRFFAFTYTTTNITQAVLYWFESAPFSVNATTQQKHVKISLITFPENQENLPSIETQMVALGSAVASYWEPIKTWSQIALLLSQQGAYLAPTTSALLIPLIGLYTFQKRKQRKANTTAYQKLSNQNKQIIDTVSETEKTTTATLNAIITTYKNKTGEPLEEQKLLQKLSETERTGIIKSNIANKHDEPIHVWKTQMTRKLFSKPLHRDLNREMLKMTKR
jgi:exosortase